MIEPNTPLSASRIKTLQTCSWLYWTNYKLKLPNKSNHGSLRGSCIHLIYECLGNPRHKHIYDKIVETQDFYSYPAIRRYVLTYAKKHDINDQENLDLINQMGVEGINFDFFGKEEKDPSDAFDEQKFDINVSENGKNYRILGFIDKLFLFKEESRILIRDFKTSKGVFEGKEAVDNMQDLMYSLAVKHIYPDYLKRNSEFLFLKFDLRGKGHLKMDQLSDDELEGFEYFLTGIQETINKFNENTAKSNFAYDKGYPAKDEGFAGKLVCGRADYEGHLKKDGSLMWHCSAKFPFFYHHIFNKNKEFITSVREEEFSEKMIPEGGTHEMKYYGGCPKFQK